MIRERSTEDVAECVSVLARVHATDGFPVHWPADPYAWLTPANLVRAWVFTVDGAIVGHAMVREGAAGHSLNRLFVAPEARGVGAGKALLDRVKQWAREQRVGLSLEVNSDQTAAIALYERAGWRRARTAPASWDSRITCHHYELVEVDPDAPPPLGEGEQHRSTVV